MDQNAQAGGDTAANAGQTANQSTQSSSTESKFEKGMDALKEGMNGKTPNAKELPEKSQDKETGDTLKDDWEKRYKEVHADRDRKVAEYEKRVEQMAMERIENDSQYVHKLAEQDRDLVDRLISKDSECQKLGIKTYDDLVEYGRKQNLPEEQRAVLDEVKALKQEVTEVKTKLTDAEKKQVEAYYTKFKDEHPEFTGEVEKQTLEMFNKSELNLEECLDYIRWKNGIQEDRNQVEEKIVRDLESKKITGALNKGDTRGDSRGRSKQLNSETVSFLEGIGANKTLEKHGYNA